MKGRDAVGSMFVLLLSVFSSPPSRANTVQVENYFEIFRRLPKSEISDKGKVCERIAEIETRQLYPSPAYEIASNIIYFNKKSENIGELDLVVIEVKTGKVVLVGEVKCWSNLATASRAARKQLARFRAKVGHYNARLRARECRCANKDDFQHCSTWAELLENEEDDDIIFISDDHHKRFFKTTQFGDAVQFRLIAPKEPEAGQYGFVTISLNLKEVEALTHKIAREHMRTRSQDTPKTKSTISQDELRRMLKAKIDELEMRAKAEAVQGDHVNGEVEDGRPIPLLHGPEDARECAARDVRSDAEMHAA